VIQWVHDTWLPAGVPYVATGESAGSSAISYSLTTYGLDALVQLLVPVSGPPHARLIYNCLSPSGNDALGTSGEHVIDGSWGFSGNGPCYLHDPNFTSQWDANSVETGGISYFWPTTKVYSIVGGKDTQGIRDNATALLNVLTANGTAASYQVVPNMGHSIAKSQDGMNALFTVLTQVPIATPTPTPTDTPTPTPTETPTPTPAPTDTPTPTPTETPTPTPAPIDTPTPTPTPTPIIQITLQMGQAGLMFSVDGSTYSSVQTFSWVRGSSHTIATTSPQDGGTGVRYLWSRWNDGGLISHTVSPTTNMTYTATFTKQYNLAMAADIGGKVSPGSSWKNSGTRVSISATPTNNTLTSYNFNGWSGTGTGSYSGANNPTSVIMNGPITEIATFTQNPIQVTVQASPADRSFTIDGNTYSTAQTFSWQPSSSHSIATTSPQSGGAGVQYAWKNWGGGGAISHTVAPTANTTYTANFTTQYYLTMVAGTGGKVSPISGWKNSGAVLSISATPLTGYIFSSWIGSGTGSYSGLVNPISITMTTPVTETASFTH